MQRPFREPHKIDGEFGEKRSYGWHSGIDENGVQGGNTDCGYKLYPITKGEIIHTSEANTGYGNIVVYQITGSWGKRWIRYCHCQEIIRHDGVVGKDDVIALLGTTGNSDYCHLHWDVIVKPLRNWRTYAKDKETLNTYFEDPEKFWAQYSSEEGNSMPNGDEKRFVEGLGEVTFGKLIEEYATERQRVIDARRERNTAQTESERVSREFALFKEDVARELETLRNRNEEEKAQHQDFLRSLANKLGTPQKKPEILEALDTLIANEDKADQYQRANKELEEKIVKLNKKITEFENGSPLTAYGRWRAFIYALTGR